MTCVVRTLPYRAGATGIQTKQGQETLRQYSVRMPWLVRSGLLFGSVGIGRLRLLLGVSPASKR